MKSSSSSIGSRLSADYDSEYSKENSMKYKEIILTLPKREPPHPYHEFYEYQGCWLPVHFLESTLQMQEKFKAQPSDIFLCSAPKTGTTWLKALAFSIMTRHLFDDSTNPLLTKVPHECLPLLELDYVSNPNFLDSELPLLATHLPYTVLPQSILESNCKIIYICREPKDTFVSMWHFIQRIEESFNKTAANPVTIDQEFKWFCEGKNSYGSYWDHVLGYWKASKDRSYRVFFLKYEDLQRDTLYYVKKLADFMEKPFFMEEEERCVPEEIVARCRFDSLSNLEVNKSGRHRPESTRGINNSLFFRTGKIGDWKNYLTEDMEKLIDDITREKLHPFGLTFSS